MPADGSPRDLDHKLQTLVDKQEIEEALVRCGHGVDRGDLDLILSAFHEDATTNYTGQVELAGERFPRTVGHASSLMKGVSHNLGNVLIQVDGDVAHSQAYVVAWQRIEHEGREIDWIIGGRYLDRFERRNGEWRIADRTLVCDWDRFDDVATKPAGLGFAAFIDSAVRGARSRDDPSYRALRF